MTTPLTTFLARTGWPDPTVGADAVAEWPEGWVSRLTALGVLSPTSPAAAVRCDGCDDHHVEAVVWVAAPHPPRAFVPCPHHGRVEVGPARLRRWAFRPGAFADRVAEAGGFAGGVAELEAGRVWRLGKTSAGGRTVVVYLARGLGWDDGPDLAARTPALQADGVAVLVPDTPPRRDIWPAGPIPPVVPLADALDLAADGFVFDHSVLAAAFPPRPARPPEATPRPFPTPAGAGWGDITLAVGDADLVATCGEVTRRFRFDEIGFADRRKASAAGLVWHLLRLAAGNSGVIPAGSRDAAAVPGGLKQRVHTLNDRLDAVFQLGRPVVRYARRTKDYRFACGISSSAPARHPLPPDAGWGDITLTELTDGRIEVAVDGSEVAAGSVGEASWARRYTLRQLGLADAHDSPTGVGGAFLRLLRGSGRFGHDVPERDRLGVNRWLAEFFDRPEPFAVTRGRMGVEVRGRQPRPAG